MLALCKLRQLGGRPRLEAHLEQVALRASSEVGAEPADDRTRDPATRPVLLDLPQRLARIRHASPSSPLKRHLRRQGEPFVPAIRRHRPDGAGDLVWITAVDREGDGAETGVADADVVDVEI